MPIVQATESFVHRANDVATEVHKGDQRSAYDPVVLANEGKFKSMSEAQVRKAVEDARPESDRR